MAAGHTLPPAGPKSYLGRRVGTDEVYLTGGRPQFLISAFYEDRVDEHISVDYLYDEDSKSKLKEIALPRLLAICEAQGVPVAGWALSRAEVLAKVDGIAGFRSDKQSDNPRHALLVKHEHLIVRVGDENRIRCDKARLVARALMEYFNQDPDADERVQQGYLLPMGTWLAAQG